MFHIRIEFLFHFNLVIDRKKIIIKCSSLEHLQVWNILEHRNVARFNIQEKIPRLLVICFFFFGCCLALPVKFDRFSLVCEIIIHQVLSMNSKKRVNISGTLLLLIKCPLLTMTTQSLLTVIYSLQIEKWEVI